jgi:hypothetical protein
MLRRAVGTSINLTIRRAKTGNLSVSLVFLQKKEPDKRNIKTKNALRRNRNDEGHVA